MTTPNKQIEENSLQNKNVFRSVEQPKTTRNIQA